MTTPIAVAVTMGRLLLAAVFAAAGLAKLADRAGTRRTMTAFGGPERLAGGMSVALPVAELVVAGLLLPASTAAYGAIGALALLALFSAAIAWSLARGRSPECHCLGRLHSEPAGRRTLARNGVLAAVAALVGIAAWEHPGPGALAWVDRVDGVGWLVLGLAASLAASLAAVVVGGYAIVHVLRSYGRVLVRLEAVEARLRAAGLDLDEPDDVPLLGLEPGTTAPAFRLPSADGGHVALDDLLRPGRPVLLVFASATCEPCRLLMPEVARWQREHAHELTVALVADGEPERVRAEAAEHGLVGVLLDEPPSAYEAYGAGGTPSAVLVAADGTIASWVAAGGDWIEALVEQALAGLGRTPGLPIGAELPSLSLEMLDGGEVEPAALVVGPTVVLFWSPYCGFCRAMHDDLLAWERAPERATCDLLVVSAGAVDDVRAERFASSVLLDPDWTASGAFGADGTPMAVLVDGDGRVASPLVTGADAVLELLGATSLAAVR